MFGRNAMIISEGSILDVLMDKNGYPQVDVVVTGSLVEDQGKAVSVIKALEKIVKTGGDDAVKIDIGAIAHYSLSEARDVLELRFRDLVNPKISEVMIVLSQKNQAVFDRKMVNSILGSFIVPESAKLYTAPKPKNP